MSDPRLLTEAGWPRRPEPQSLIIGIAIGVLVGVAQQARETSINPSATDPCDCRSAADSDGRCTK